MVPSMLRFGLLALYSTQALAASCSRSTTAKAGDTCASLGATYGLSVADFLRANPGLSVCSLVTGATYCVAADGSTATGPPAPATGRPIPVPTTTPGQPTASLTPSPDGSDGICGGKYTCLGSVYGDCCSLNGYCGNGTDYCNEGCNPAFGRCGGGVAAPPPSSSCAGGSTVTVTAAPSTVTVTVTKTATATPAPSPTFTGAPKNCARWYQVKATDRCQAIARAYGVTTTQLSTWNPGFDCYDVEDMAGYYLCVGVSA